jgi:hypothetical protein
MTRCDPRIVRVIWETASGSNPSDPYMARVAMALGLVAPVQNRLWPTQLGTQVARAMHGAEG